MTKAFQALVKRQFENQLIDKWTYERVTLTKINDTYSTEVGFEGYKSGDNETETIIKGAIFEITESDTTFDDLGHIEVGDAHGYFKVDDDVTEKDFITSPNSKKKFQVTKLANYGKIHGKLSFNHVLLAFREQLT